MSIGTNTPFGFMPVSVSDTGNSTFNTQQYNINPANTTPIGVGDLVVLDSNGYVVLAAPQSPVTTYQRILGVFQGVVYEGNNQPVILSQPNNWSGASNGQTVIIANILVSPTYLFAAQFSGAGLTQAQLYNTANFNFVAGAVNGSTGQSTMTVDSTSATNSANAPLKCVGLAPGYTNGSIQNAYGVQYNVGLFMLNTPFFATNSAGA